MKKIIIYTFLIVSFRASYSQTANQASRLDINETSMPTRIYGFQIGECLFSSFSDDFIKNHQIQAPYLFDIINFNQYENILELVQLEPFLETQWEKMWLCFNNDTLQGICLVVERHKPDISYAEKYAVMSKLLKKTYSKYYLCRYDYEGICWDGEVDEYSSQQFELLDISITVTGEKNGNDRFIVSIHQKK